MSQDLLNQYGNEAVANIRDNMETKWGLLTDLQKRSAERAARRLIELDLKVRAGVNVSGDLEFVKSTVNELKLAMEIAASDLFWTAFWNGVNKALEALTTVLITAGKTAIGLNLGGIDFDKN